MYCTMKSSEVKNKYHFVFFEICLQKYMFSVPIAGWRANQSGTLGI